jgi:beta-lactam-binding protein with PASTA domain
VKSIFTKQLFLNLLIAIGIIALMLFLVNWSLKIYTRHGQSMVVPDLKGKSFTKAEQILSSANLEYKILDSTFQADLPPNSILDQTPKPGTKVKQGRTIYLTLNAYNAPLVEIPDLVGKSSLKYAQMQLESYGLIVTEPIFKPSPYQNAVLEILYNGKPVAAKTKIAKGSTITLVVGQGVSSEEVNLPYLIGLPYSQALSKLKNDYGLTLGALIIDDGIRDTSNAIVYRQSPDFIKGKTMRAGQEVDIFVGKGCPKGLK